MADSNNFSDINDNFDTIKTLLNSIRAQGILNTSDVDKLLEGINSKLEKINTEEDIDLIKAFLSELKKNLDERHEVLISKFGAIESLFSNLLKNSNDSVKSVELKELFDIIATNLSVFSREVVSQKETLTDITLRLDAMRSDDSQKRDIIKSVSSVRNDVEKVNNAFDSIVISLNENFKTVLKTISEIDQSEAIKGFAAQLTDILNSSNTILSAIQLIDKKNTSFEDAFEKLVTQDDISSVQKNLVELSLKSQELINLVDLLSQKSYKIDNLAEKIDASVSIIAGLKSEIADKDSETKNSVLERLSELEVVVREVSSDSEFEEFKKSLENVLQDIFNSSEQLKGSLESASGNISKLNDDLRALNINTNFQELSAGMVRVGEDIKEKFVSESDKMSQIMEVNLTRTLSEIASSSEFLNTRLKEAHSAISDICERNFTEVTGGITSLKDVVAQLDENNVSANNAIFSNITDRLAIFESSLKNSLEKQEDFVSNSSSGVFEQISNLKSITEGLEYKLDANAIEFGNAKRDFDGLVDSINKVLALDFVNVVQDFKVDLYAIKQDLTNAAENAQNELSETITKDLFSKYELLVSKLDNVEEEMKFTQTNTLNSLQTLLGNISSSLVDVLSYVSSAKDVNNKTLEARLAEVTNFIQDNNLNYIENVRDIVDVIRAQVENNLRQINGESDGRFNRITATIAESNRLIREDLGTAYNKILEVQGNVLSLNESVNSTNDSMAVNVNNIIETAEGLKTDFDYKLTSLKNSLLDMVTEFKKDFTCENADKISEIKFNAENLNAQAQQQSIDLKNELRDELGGVIEKLEQNVSTLNELVSGTTSNLESAVNNLSSETTNALSGTLAKILDNFVSLGASLNSFDEKNTEKYKQCVEDIKQDFDSVKRKIAQVDSQIDEDLARQITIIEGNFESLNLMLTDIMKQTTDSLGEKIKTELDVASNQMKDILAEELEQYKIQIEALFEGVRGKNNEQAEFIKGCVLELNSVLDSTLTHQGKEAAIQLEEVGTTLKQMLYENIELTSADYEALKTRLNEFVDRIEKNNNILADTVKIQLDQLIKFVNSNLDVQAQQIDASFEDISLVVQRVVTAVQNFNTDWGKKLSEIKAAFEDLKQDTSDRIDEKSSDILEKLGVVIDSISAETESSLFERLNSIKAAINGTQNRFGAKVQEIVDQLISLQSTSLEQNNKIKDIFNNDIKQRFIELDNKLEALSRDNVLKLSTNIENSESNLSEKITAGINGIRASIANLVEKNDKNEALRLDAQQTLIEALNNSFNDIINDFKEETRNDISSIAIILGENGKKSVEKLNSLGDSAEFIKEQIEKAQQNTTICRELISNLIKEHCDIISKNIEKETETVVANLDKKVVETIIDKSEEIKLLSVEQNKSFDRISDSVSGLVSKFVDSKNEINASLNALLNGINESVDDLRASFSDLRAGIMNKSFDEAFHESVHNQITGIEDLVKEQMGYIEDISDLCCSNLPELSEMSAIVKHNIVQSIAEIQEQIKYCEDDAFEEFGTIRDSISKQEEYIKQELNSLKTDVVTQFINIFNQISFVAEQEEIIDFIQEKHSELISILSHIVTTVEDVENVKDNLAVVDNKIDTLKEDIDLINEKITSIMSSEGDIDYVYSLQDLESDIANLRLVLNEMKSDNKSKEFEELIASTNNIYQIVETIKSELPKFEAEEFKKDFNTLAEDIVSISTRTNKLILTSDESYKTLQDNLQDFKLVIDDLDERTKNFAHESGIDRLDQKLASINTMIQNGAKTNQVFNQVFEYLAEWVDKAGEQITTISDKVDTLDDIGQIKVMLEDLRAESHDSSYSEELVSSLEMVFEKQAKRISSLEAKLDKIIVASNINSKKSKTDIKPLEDTLNRFLVALDDKISSQQDKINSLEMKLEEVVSLVDNNDTAQLTKKVGGMDRQLAKLNKSIEKIASNVVEK